MALRRKKKLKINDTISAMRKHHQMLFTSPVRLNSYAAGMRANI